VPGGTVGTAGPGSLSLSVKNADDTRASAALSVTEAPAPALGRVTVLNQCSSIGPRHVRLTGDNFTTDTTLESNGQSVAIAWRSTSLLSFSLPGVEDSADIKVTVPPPGGGEASILVSTPRRGDADEGKHCCRGP